MKNLLISLFILLFAQAAFTQCLPSGITFTTQAQIDSFAINYPGCSKIGGDIKIEGSGIQNLNGLEPLSSLDQSLFISNCHYLKNLEGLNNLTTIEGRLKIIDNGKLETLAGLNNLTSIWKLHLENNHKIKSLEGLEKLTPSNLSILNNDSLKTLAGLNNFVSINDLVIRNNTSLNNLEALKKLTINDYLYIWNNESLESLEGLNDLTSIEHLYILNNANLRTLEALNNVTSIGHINIWGNANLEALTGLNHITSTNYLYLLDNANLENLEGLNNLTKIDGYLKIINNPLLNNIDAVANIDPSTIHSNGWTPDGLIIKENPNLSQCSIPSICGYFDNSNIVYDVSDNKSGCNSSDEILENCVVSLSETATYTLALAPNPTSDFVRIKIDCNIDNILIYNNLGQLVLSQKQKIIDVSHFPKGIYTVEVLNQPQIAIGKLMVE